jgi:tetratricopeptide (TPR) repeat protein
MPRAITDRQSLPHIQKFVPTAARSIFWPISIPGWCMAPDAATRLAGALADRYRIERELGSGGMATVYLAHDLRHDRQVAIKVLHPHLAELVGAERFLKEIRTTAHLQHPHILPLFDSGEADGLLFYVMPYVDGESLRQLIAREKRLPVADAVRITSEIASALDYAHRHGVIHRDIKPENILLHDGRALVADFGIALAPTSGETRLTEAGVSIGTPGYMSPEQALGERTLSACTDIYAVGAMMYEMLTGSPPFTGPSAQAIVAKVITEKPVPPSRLRKEIPAQLEDAVLTALQKNPADRFPTAAALQAAIEGKAGVPSQRGSRRRRAMWVAGAVACLVVLGGLAVRPWQGRTRMTVRAPPDTAAKRLVAEAADWAKRRDRKSCEMAITLYSHATDEDTSYAAAWGGLAKARALCTMFTPGDPAVGFAAAKGASETALRLDSTLSDAYTARGMVHLFHEQNFPAAQVAFAKAISLDSTRFEPWLFRSWAYIGVGRLDAALSSVRRAKELQPVGDPIVGVRLSTILRYNGRVKEAQSALDDVLSGDSTNRLARGEQLEFDAETRQCDKAAKDLLWVDDNTGAGIKAFVAYLWASCGEPRRARAYADSVAAQATTGAFVDFLSLAVVYAGLGDSDKMFQALSQAVAQHNALLFFLGHHFAFRPYHGNPQFTALMKSAHVK